jgi:hypothetical protein
MRHHHALELDRVLGRAGCGFHVAVIDRHRKILQRDMRDVGAGERQFLGRERGKARIERAGADRSGENENAGIGHQTVPAMRPALSRNDQARR